MRILLLVALCLAGCRSTGLDSLTVEHTRRAFPAGTLALDAPAHGLTFAGPLILVACGDAGLRVVDASRIDAPESIATVTGCEADRVAVGPDYALALRGTGWTRATSLTRVDLLDPRAPLIVDRVDFDGGSTPSVSVEGSQAAVTDGDLHLSQGLPTFERVALGRDVDVEAALLRRGSLFAVVRPRPALIATKSAPRQLVTFDADRGERLSDLTPLLRDGDGPPHLALTGDHLLLVAGATLASIDVSDPSAPLETGGFAIDGVDALACDGDLGAILRDGSVYLLDLSRPETPLLAGRVALETHATAVAVQDGVVAIASESWLRLFQVETRDDAP